MTLQDFHTLLGQTVMYCQIIKHDIKMIYSAMLKGEFNKNLGSIEKLTLGTHYIKKIERT